MEAPRLKDWLAPRLKDWQAPRLKDWQAPRLKDWLAPRLKDWQAPRLKDWQAPRLKGWLAPKLKDWFAALTLTVRPGSFDYLLRLGLGIKSKLFSEPEDRFCELRWFGIASLDSPIEPTKYDHSNRAQETGED